MELSWTTFILEIINFLVLVWILIHFLYQPVLNIIQKRQSNIEKILEDAKAKFADAEILQQQYETRLSDWEHEKQQKRDVLQQKLQDERQQRLQQLDSELSSERKKAAVIDERLKSEQQNHYQQEALIRASRFSSKLLTTVASPELEKQLIALSIKSLSSLDDDRITSLRQACNQALDKIIVCSVYPVEETQRAGIEQTLQALCAHSVPFEYKQDQELIAGLRIIIGSWVLRLNLQDELTSFTSLSHD